MFAAIFTWLASTLLQAVLMRRRRPPLPKPLGLGEFTGPTVEEGRAIPAWWGTCKLDGPNDLWHGDLFAIDAAWDVMTGGGIRGGGLLRTPTGIYHYHLGMHLSFGWGPIDELLEIRFDDRPVTAGGIIINETNDTIRFGAAFELEGPESSSYHNAVVPHGRYTTLMALCQAATAACVDIIGDGAGRFWYGYHVVTGYNDRLTYTVTYPDTTERTVVFYLPQSQYPTGAAWGSAVTLAQKAAELASTGGSLFDDTREVALNVTYDEVSGKFTFRWSRPVLAAPDVTRVRIDMGQIRNCLPSAGVMTTIHDAFADTDTAWDYTPFSVITDLVTRRDRVHAGWGTTFLRFRWDDARSTFGPVIGVGALYQRSGWNTSDPPNWYYVEPSAVALPTGFSITDMGDYWRIHVNAPTLFGGDDRDGGVVGDFDLYKGTETQEPNDYLETVLGRPMPAYLGEVYMVARRVYLGTSPVLKSIAIVARRTPNGLALTGGKENIEGDVNPANQLFEIATNTRWGCGIAEAAIDVDSFVAMGEALYAEGLGLSMVADTAREGGELVKEIERHIDAHLYPERSTGLVHAKLVRPDYDPDDLLVVDEDVAGEVTEMSRQSTANFITVKYVNREANWTARTARAYDGADIAARGGRQLRQEVEFGGASRAPVAQLLAARQLLGLSAEWRSFRIPANRQTSRLRPGDPFILKSARLGIVSMPCRVGPIDLGSQTGQPLMIQAAQDIYGQEWTAFAPPVTDWEDPIAEPLPAAAAAVMETPFALAGGDQRFVTTLAARTPGDTSVGYEVESDPTGGTAFALTNRVGAFAATGLLEADLGYTDSELTLGTVIGAELIASATPAEFEAGRNVLLIGSELIAWQTLTDNGDGTFTLGGLVRGVCDTMPATHAAGGRAWAVTSGSGTTTPTPYPVDVTVAAKHLPYNASGAVDPSGAATVTATTVSRSSRPYAPRDVLLNGDAYPDNISGELTVDWTHRNRLTTWSYATGGATSGLEAGCTYRLRFYDGADTLLRTVTGLTDTTYTWSDEAADSGGELNAVVRVVLDTVAADGTVSYQAFDFTVGRGGFGLDGFGDTAFGG